MDGNGVNASGPGSHVRQIAEPIARALQLDIVDVECQGRGARTIIRVFVGKEGGIAIQDCERLHHSLSRALDVADAIPHAYRLEVSSPGLDRPLTRRKDYQQIIGQNIRINVRQPVDGHQTLRGRLDEVTDQGITLRVRARSARTRGCVVLPWEAIDQAKRDIDW